MKILNHKTGETIYENAEAKNIKELVEEAVRKNVKLYYADLSDTDLTGATLIAGAFDYADFSRAKMDHANLDGADFSYANMEYVWLFCSYGKVKFQGAKMYCANLRESKFLYSNFKDVILTSAIMYDGNFSYSDFKNADMSKTDQTNAIMMGCNFEDVNMRYSHLKDTNFSEACLYNTDIHWAFIKDVNFHKTNIGGVFGVRYTAIKDIEEITRTLQNVKFQYDNEIKNKYSKEMKNLGIEVIEKPLGDQAINLIKNIKWYLDSKNQTFAEYREDLDFIIKENRVITAEGGVLATGEVQQKDVVMFDNGVIFYNDSTRTNLNIDILQNRAVGNGIEITDFIPVDSKTLEKAYWAEFWEFHRGS